ncbi:MAG: hypothetical protein Fur006_57890 [Coleofasciculaceae cyanobacterium]
MWLKLKAKEIAIVSSELALLETLALPLRNSATDLIQTYEELLTASEMQLIPVTRSVLRTAANLRATTNLKTPSDRLKTLRRLTNCRFWKRIARSLISNN